MVSKEKITAIVRLLTTVSSFPSVCYTFKVRVLLNVRFAIYICYLFCTVPAPGLTYGCACSKKQKILLQRGVNCFAHFRVYSV